MDRRICLDNANAFLPRWLDHQRVDVVHLKLQPLAICRAAEVLACARPGQQDFQVSGRGIGILARDTLDAGRMAKLLQVALNRSRELCRLGFDPPEHHAESRHPTGERRAATPAMKRMRE